METNSAASNLKLRFRIPAHPSRGEPMDVDRPIVLPSDPRPDDGDIPDQYPLALDGPLVEDEDTVREPDGPLDLSGTSCPMTKPASC